MCVIGETREDWQRRVRTEWKDRGEASERKGEGYR